MKVNKSRLRKLLLVLIVGSASFSSQAGWVKKVVAGTAFLSNMVSSAEFPKLYFSSSKQLCIDSQFKPETRYCVEATHETPKEILDLMEASFVGNPRCREDLCWDYWNIPGYQVHVFEIEEDGETSNYEITVRDLIESLQEEERKDRDQRVK